MNEIYQMYYKCYCCVGVLVQQRNALITENESLKEERELAVNALNVTHEVSVQSLHERFENELASQLAAG